MSVDVHQIRYRWSERTLLGARGMGPVESTMPDDVLATWDPHLRDHVWAVGRIPAYTFLVLGGVGVLIRKIATVAEDGRSGSAAHVLLSGELTAEHALGLTSWSGWEAPLCHGMPWSAIDDAVASGLADVRARARKLPPERLAGMFVALLDEPRAAYTVIGEADPLALTCALGDLVGRAPTFASDEADDNGSRLPTAVFLREAPVSVTVTTRRRLIPAEARVDPTASFAAAAVDAYIADGVSGVVHVRPPEPPADATATREWAAAAQLTPGILADLTRLPSLSPHVLTGLARPEGLDRIATVASNATSCHLGDAVTLSLPDQIVSVIVREALTRVFTDPDEEALLGRLAAVGPLPLQLMAECPSSDLDQLVRVGQALLTPADRQILVQQAARSIGFSELFGWIDERAASVPEDAASAYVILCELAERAESADWRTVAERGALVDAVRRFAGSEPQTSMHVARLLAALPKRVLVQDVIAELVDRGDPALLHALETVVTDPTGRDAIRRGVRVAFYRSHQLDVPESEPGRTAGSWWRRRWSRHRPADNRKSM